jgi:Tol biopolymer transport system component/DNA-binding winged helix-turn-helix (wHTH) protein
MAKPASASSVVRFGPYEADLRIGELRRDGRRIKLQEQPFRILSLLLERPGELITRDELRGKLWPADTFVDFDHGLNSGVARLREALGDSADKPLYIETIAKRGYRFIASLPELAPPVGTEVPDLGSRKGRKAERHRWGQLGGGAALVLVIVSVVGVWYRSRSDRSVSLLEVVPLVGLRGFQATPAFSPDGSLVAFRQSNGARNTGIYTALVGGENPVQLTHDPGDCCPSWSPDGRQIALTRYFDHRFSIVIVPALGGTERHIYQGAASMGGGLTWSPSGKSLAFPESSAADSPRSWIALLWLADSTTRALTLPPAGSADHEPAFSPDGSQVAFVRSSIAGVSNDVFVIPSGGGAAKRLTFDNQPIMGPPAWTADGRELVFSSGRGMVKALWRVSVTGGLPRPVAGPFAEAAWPSISAKGNTLVYEEGVSKFNLWRLPLRNATHYERPPSPFIVEKGDKMRPDLSPDGKKVAFESDRLGFWDIWTCDTSGFDCQQVTSLHQTAGRARWSPNGHYIAFEFHPQERSEIYIAEVPGGTPHLLRTIRGADNLSPSWSRNGHWLYFSSKQGREPFQVWKIPFSGGVAMKLTQDGGISAVESPDERFLYYSKYEKGGIWRLPIEGGRETEVVEDLDGKGWPNWAVSREGIYFLRCGEFKRPSIDFLEFRSGKTFHIWTLEKEPGWGLSLAPDGRSLTYVQSEYVDSNIMLVRNFR